jgi:serine/threonine protein kinase
LLNLCLNEKIDEELSDKFEEKPKDQYIRNNLRESLLLKERDNPLQNIIITKEKLDNLSKQTKIPLIQETDFTFLNEIGEGTYGEVFLVENNSTSEQYAMKKIICRDYTELIKHKKELELIFSLKHDNILKLLGIQFKYLDETTCLIYVLMELAFNDWNNEIKRRTLAKKYYKEKELIDILKQLVKAFLFLQKKNIVHRDIKPQNILLFPNNIYKIADFGEAKNIKNKAEQSTLRGSELFMSPLLYKGYKYNQKKVVHNPYKSDVFSLGFCILYTICLNIKVIESLREVNTIKDVMNTINKFNVNVNGKYSEKFMKIIYGMIEPNEEIRFDFEDLSLELNKI